MPYFRGDSFVFGISDTVMLKEITESMKQMATEKAKGDLALSSTYIDDVMSGDWQVKNNKLYKGQTQINGNENIVDLLGEKTGDTITIFQGDTRVATNVMKNGERAVGRLLLKLLPLF